MDQKLIEQSVRNIFKAIGEDPDRVGLQETPQRVAKMYAEIFSSVGQHDFDAYKIFDTDASHDGELITVTEIPFYSMCEHHLLPFFGTVSVGYIPQNGRVIGLSKIPRLVDYAAHRPTLQEAVTSQIGDILMEILNPAGVAVIVKARHMCVEMRGVNKTGCVTKTTYYKGAFKEARLRQEFMETIQS